MISVDVLIPSHGRIDSLARCVASVARQEYTDLRICIADDASNPPLREDDLRPDPHPLQIVRLDNRGGVVAARIELLRRLDSEVALFLDDDTSLHSEHTISDIISVFETVPRAGIVALALEDRIGDRRRILSPIRKADHDSDEFSRVGWFYGAAFAIRRAVIDEVGPPTASVYYGHEEIELSYLAVRAGYEIVCLHGPRVTHYRSTPDELPNDTAKSRFRFAIRNRLVLARTYLPHGYRQSHILIWLARYLWFAVRAGRLGSYVRGVRDGLFSTHIDSGRKIDHNAVRYLSRFGGRLWY